MIIDSHAHLDDEQFDLDRKQVVDNLKKSGIDAVINIGTSLNTSLKAIQLSKKYDFIYATVGIHPEDLLNFEDKQITELKKLAQNNKKVVAIGEIGLDYHYPNFNRENQIKLFESQLELAMELNLPVVIHSRNAFQDSVPIVKNYNLTSVIFHCYSGNWELAKNLLSMGYYLSFAGNLTYSKSTDLVETVKNMPLNRILAETDCPYLAPVPFRGKRNEPAFVKQVIQKMSEIRNCSLEEIEKATWENCCKIFNIEY